FRILEAEEPREADTFDQRERRFEVFARLARKPDDDVRRNRDPGDALSHKLDALDVFFDRVATDHPLEHAVASGLNGHVHVTGEDRKIGMRSDETRREVARVRTRVAKP